MPPGISEPAKIYWAVGIAASLALHASGVAGTALLAGHYVRGSAPTEITFSDEASPAATSVPAQAETVSASAAAPVEQERLAPSTAETSATSAAETLKPLETDTASTAEAEQSSETAALKPETAQPLQVNPASTPETQQLQAEASTPEAVQSSEATALPPEASEPAEAIQPPASPERTSASQAEKTIALANEDVLDASESSERLASSPADVTSVSGESAEKVAALEQSAGVDLVTALPADQPEPASSSADTPSAQAIAPISSKESTAEPTTNLKPETFQPSDAQMETALAVPAQSETAGPIRPTAETVTGLEPDVSPSATQPPDDLAEPAVIIPAQPEAARPIEEPVETALLVPARPGSSLGTEVDKPSDRYRRIVDFVRQYAGGDCFIALPAMNPEGDVTFQTFGRDKLREDAFLKALFSLDGLQAEISSGNVADPQCLALSFAREVKRYPGFSLMIDLDDAEMASGTELSGSVLNANGRELHLLLVDDEGQVQSLDRVLSVDGDADRSFRTPLTLTGGPVVTKQILIAITTDPALPSLTASVNERANEFFRRLGEEIDASGADIDLAVEGFSVR